MQGVSGARNLLNLKEVEKGYGSRSVLHGITLGVAAGERIGVVGQNGGGKSTLLRLIAGVEQPDRGTLTRAGDVGVALLGQQDELDPTATIRDGARGRARRPRMGGGSERFAACLTACSVELSCGAFQAAWIPRSPGCPAASEGGSRLRG